ncbi:response regulator transcription factor [Anaerorhabdus sp.]|jgi:two-component system, OmpR family, alkaline phosphatase synthesis response regulator PhoP|uniref:response regulator transcription factor n=1 Tax=Anaerorhabdus sp. TaxID=1872524 RepID=UPI002FC81FF5
MIYCVEDEQNILELIVYTLNNTGFQAKGFSDATSFYPALADEKPELILLDIMLPGESGLSILKQLKTSITTKNIPVILVTAKNSEYDKVQGLDLGADDYITKPFGIMELVARVKAVLRRTDKPTPTKSISYKDLTIDTQRHFVLLGDKRIVLTLKEFELLKLLMENQGIVLTREQLLEQIWGYDYYGETRTVDVHIRTLRSKLDHASDYIETIRGVGYKMVDIE